MSEGTSPSDNYDDGSGSTPSNLPKAATYQRKNRNSNSEDEDYVAAEECRVSGSGRPLRFKHWGARGDLSPTDLRPILSCELR